MKIKVNKFIFVYVSTFNLISSCFSVMDDSDDLFDILNPNPYTVHAESYVKEMINKLGGKLKRRKGYENFTSEELEEQITYDKFVFSMSGPQVLDPTLVSQFSPRPFKFGQGHMLIDNFRKSDYQDNMLVNSIDGVDISTTRTFHFNNYVYSSKLPCRHLRYNPSNSEGNLKYFFNPGLNVLSRFQDPKLLLSFNSIGKPFDVDVSLTDFNNNSATYSPLKCSWSEHNYVLDLMSLNSQNLDLSMLKEISLTFRTTEGEEHKDDTLLSAIGIIPEPFSTITLGAGIIAFIKKEK